MPRSYHTVFFIYTFTVSICISSLAYANGFCPFPSIPEESASSGNHIEIPRGQCKLITIRGKLKYETVTLSLDETYGSGFFFNEDNGPKTVILGTNNQALVCSSSSSCGSTAILMQKPEGTTEVSSVRSNTGKWRKVDSICAIRGPATSMDGSFYVLTAGRHQIKQTYMQSYAHSTLSYNPLPPPECPPHDCGDKCSRYSMCDIESTGTGCTECIELNDYHGDTGEFPCYTDMRTYTNPTRYTTSVQCVCSGRLWHNIFQCQ